MNNYCALGRLVRDPEVRVSQNGTKTARYTLAVNRMKKGEADFIPCVAFGKAADFTEKYFTKGMQVAIIGHLQSGSYTDKNGNKRSTLDVIIESQFFADSKRDAFVQTEEKLPEAFEEIDGMQDELPF